MTYDIMICKAAECEEDEEKTVLYGGVNGASSLVLAVNWIFLCRLSIRPLLPAKHSLFSLQTEEDKKIHLPTLDWKPLQ